MGTEDLTVLSASRLNSLYIRYTQREKKQILARGSVVVKALCYKQEGRGFDTR
jgi:hypothetical protein